MRHWIIAVFVCAFAVAGCATLPSGSEPLSVGLADFSMIDFGLIEQKLGLRLRIQNPNNVEIPVEGLSYEMELNGKPFAKGVAHPQTRVPAFGTAEIDTEAVSNLAGFIGQLSQLQHDPKLRYRLIGKLYSGSWQGARPFESEGEISLPDFGGWKSKLEQLPLEQTP
jgi:LEA14-like dessication related protein